MSRFFFDVRSGNTWTNDAAGEVFADYASASDAALDIIQSIVRDEKRSSGAQEFSVRVRDETGRVTFEASFTLQQHGVSIEA